MFEFIVAHTWIYLVIIVLISLIIGSFLNVIIHRLPIILEKNWRRQCKEYFEEPDDNKLPFERYNLALPPSHCPFCYTVLTIWENIPIVSYLILRGKCATCKTRIPIRYLLVETITCVLSAIAALQIGPSIELLAVLILTWFLVPISFIDTDSQLLPDILTLPLLWLGLFFSCFNFFTNSHDAILGAIIGYLFFWIIDHIFKLITKKEGIGQGDFKLLAAGGAWLGWQILPFIILTSSLLGLIVGVFFIYFKRLSRNTPFPYGPFIAIAIWLGVIWGFDLTQSYLQLFGITWSNM